MLLELLGLDLGLASGEIWHGFLRFFVYVAVALIAAWFGRPFGLPVDVPTPRLVLNRDQEQLRYWLDEAQRPGADVLACLTVARIYCQRLGNGPVDDRLRRQFDVATLGQHYEGDFGGR